MCAVVITRHSKAPAATPILADANHFLQEDRGPEVADRIASFVAAT